ncbi:xanthine dehydrogenase small subunit [Glaciimonas sp. Gout2]|uniref:xanthine dehydrogenase small subunit n=1 Tax=unclassified Glaciimonas TaxID=2644401 RepID=UPI002B238B86|nr:MULTISPECIES: xanthine dehydrogenase small subunit [unclassified Glaciimonas]MEB0010787.1 xanthine dehydrogenase small subunit [Glaciimonas sp. Cout2]MEB0082077.1 xanthine dehydrogenase small subunit [Glaciimonas sp. Gout2]
MSTAIQTTAPSGAASSPIRFFYRGEVHTVDRAAPTRTILQHLREDLHCTGTKEGCAEGDCGACTVVIGEIGADGVQMKSVNSCIQFLPTLDGKALFTVEDLKQQDGALHPVQQAMVECHGSQCGFCTPGFVMSLWDLYLKNEGVHALSSSPATSAAPTSQCLQSQQSIQWQPLQRQDIDLALSGNLCRCTGYRPIIDAAHRMGELPLVNFDRDRLQASLQLLQRDELFTYSYEGQHFYAPRTLQQLVDIRAMHPAARMLAGSTDVGLWVTKQMRDLGDIIFLGQVKELATVVIKDGQLHIGAGVTLNDAYSALSTHYPELREMWQRFASLPIRNAGTLGGNVANGSPIGDSPPWLIALGAEVVLRGPTGQRVMPLESLYLDYMKKDMQPDEFVESVRVPLPNGATQFRTYKLAKRFDQDISAVCAAFSVVMDGDNIGAIRIAFGGMAATPKRAAKAEASLLGQPWDETRLQSAMALLAEDFAPLSDMRASSTYRMKTAQNLLRRFWLETRIDAPLRPDQVNAFASVACAA